jgi:tetratricopeptide (TPR) repeat protein
MRRLIVTVYSSLDGVIEGEGNAALETWQLPFADDEFERRAEQQLDACDALLLGRRTYQGFAEVWPTMAGDNGIADRLNGLRNDLGVVYQRQGSYDKALTCLRESLAIRRELGDPHAEAECLRELGVTLRALDRLEEARRHWQEALAIFERLRTTDAGQVRALLAVTRTRAGFG